MLAKTNLKTPERLEEIQNRTPLRGFAKEKDLGMAAAFLCSDAARFISGIDLVVDGGISSSFVSALSKGGFSMHTNPVIMIARC